MDISLSAPAWPVITPLRRIWAGAVRPAKNCREWRRSRCRSPTRPGSRASTASISMHGVRVGYAEPVSEDRPDLPTDRDTDQGALPSNATPTSVVACHPTVAEIPRRPTPRVLRMARSCRRRRLEACGQGSRTSSGSRGARARQPGPDGCALDPRVVEDVGRAARRRHRALVVDAAKVFALEPRKTPATSDQECEAAGCDPGRARR